VTIELAPSIYSGEFGLPLMVRVLWAGFSRLVSSRGPDRSDWVGSSQIHAYSSLDFGYAGALSVVLLLVMLTFTWLYLRTTKGLEDTE
jgi:hypothetical protein